MEEESLTDEEFAIVFGHLLEQGVYTFVEFDEDGEAVYEFNAEVAKEVCPDIYWEVMSDIDRDMLSLVDKGLVEMDFTLGEDGLETTYVLTDLGKEIAEQ